VLAITPRSPELIFLNRYSRRMKTISRRMRAAVETSRARRRLAREIAEYRTPNERHELDLILSRHTAEEIAEIDAILRLT
jgi:hypothetical protein